jgi:hypothetical protein
MVLLAGSKRVRAQGHEKLTIGLSPFINQATIFLANELGYFSKMGLDIDMKIFMDGALVVAPMLLQLALSRWATPSLSLQWPGPPRPRGHRPCHSQRSL